LDAETGRQKSPPKRVNARRDQNPGCEWPEIPAERPYLASYRKRAVCGDWMVVGAVCCEPVSARLDLLFRKNAANEARRWRRRRKSFNDCVHLVLFSSLWGRKITGSEQVGNRSTTGPYPQKIRRPKTSAVFASSSRENPLNCRHDDVRQRQKRERAEARSQTCQWSW
jgi:hypothetical protein